MPLSARAKKILPVGSRAQVMHGNAKKTSGGLTKSKLKYNKQGKIVSKKASSAAKRNNNLVKSGWVTKKGVYGAFKKIHGPIYGHSSCLPPDHMIHSSSPPHK